MHGTMNKQNSEKNHDFYKQMYPSPLGEMSLVANESGLVGVWFLQQKYFEHGLEEGNLLLEKNDVLKETELLLEHYFSGDCPDFRVFF